MKEREINQPAVRAYYKALASNERYINALVYAEADRGFDGGEWSDTHNAGVIWEIESKTRIAVAARFGLTGDQLWFQSEAACQYELYRLQKAAYERVQARCKHNAPLVFGKCSRCGFKFQS